MAQQAKVPATKPEDLTEFKPQDPHSRNSHSHPLTLKHKPTLPSQTQTFRINKQNQKNLTPNRIQSMGVFYVYIWWMRKLRPKERELICGRAHS